MYWSRLLLLYIHRYISCNLQLQVKQGEEDDDLALDSDSNHLLEEELNEASQEPPLESKWHAEKRSTTPVQPPLSKRTKTKHSTDPTIDSLSNLTAQDECIMYGQYIARKLMQMNSRTRSAVEHAISNVLFEANMGKYDDAHLSFDYKQQTPTTTFLNSPLDEMNLFPSASGSPKEVQSPLASEVSEAVPST